MLAAWSGNLTTVKMLLDAGADIDFLDGEGKTALIWAALLERDDVVRYLLDKRASIDIKDQSELTALEWAEYMGSESTCQVFKG